MEQTITIDNITDVRHDKNNRAYRLIYTPETWSEDSNGNIIFTKSQKIFCYDESKFDKLKPGISFVVR